MLELGRDALGASVEGPADAVGVVRLAIVDAGVHVPEGSTIGFDHQADREAGHTVSDGGVVVVASRSSNGWPKMGS